MNRALSAPLASIASMHEGQGDVLWDAVVALMLTAGPVQERDSRYGDKPALVTGSREIAHREAPGVIDLRITRDGWSRVSAEFGDDPAVHRDPGRRDWIELHLSSLEDLDRLAPVLRAAMAANA